jgi:hypothetical protein
MRLFWKLVVGVGVDLVSDAGRGFVLLNAANGYASLDRVTPVDHREIVDEGEGVVVANGACGVVKLGKGPGHYDGVGQRAGLALGKRGAG